MGANLRKEIMVQQKNFDSGAQRRFLDAPIATGDGSAGTEGKRIRGYAAVFNQQTELYPGMREQVAPGAFADAISKDDVRALINHDANYVLGRTKAGTLSLREDNRGLYYEVIPPDTQTARDLMTSIKRGDISGSSFGFFILDKTMTKAKDYTLRTIKKVKLLDVSVVTFPAYPQTDGVSARYSMQAQAISDSDLFARFDALKKMVAQSNRETNLTIRRARLNQLERLIEKSKTAEGDDALWTRFEIQKLLNSPE
jgi:HK97 family phage prohead protease